MNYGLSHYAAKMHLQNMIDRLYKNKSNTANTPLGDLSIYSLLLDISEG